jgi:hypothetical protein
VLKQALNNVFVNRSVSSHLSSATGSSNSLQKRTLRHSDDKDNFDDLDVHFTTTYGVIGKLLTDVKEEDEQKVLEFLHNYPDNMQATRWSIRFNIEDKQANILSLPTMTMDQEGEIKDGKSSAQATTKKSTGTKGLKRSKH